MIVRLSGSRSSDINVSVNPYVTHATQADSASFALTASVALAAVGTITNAETASVALQAITASYSFTASFSETASYIEYANVQNKPALVSSSVQINTGSFTGSFTGGVLGSASFAATTWTSIANKPIGIASSSTQINTGSFTGSFTGAFTGILPAISFTSLTNIPSGLVSQSAQVNTGSFTGSFIGTASTAISASYSLTASYVSGSSSDWNTLSNKPSGLVSSSIQINSGSFTGSFTGTVQGSSSYAASSWNNINNIPAALVSSSTQINTGSFSGSLDGSASFAATTWTAVNNRPVGLVSSSTQVNTGSFTGSFTGGVNGTASWAAQAISASWAPGVGGTADWNTLINKPAGIVSSSDQINTGSFTGSFTGTFNGSASYATTAWDDINNVPAGLFSSSTQINTGSFTGSFTGGFFGSASFATTTWTSVNNKPVGIISSSDQINTGSFTGSFVGGLTGLITASGLSIQANSITLSSSTTNQLVSIASLKLKGGANLTDSENSFVQLHHASGSSITELGAIVLSAGLFSASSGVSSSRGTIELRTKGKSNGGWRVETSGTLSPITTNYVDLGSDVSLIRNIYSVSSSIQYMSGTLIGTASLALNVLGGVESASYAPTVWNDISNVPVGLISASQQVNTGSFTGSFTGGFQGTSSWAVSASWAPGVGGTADWNTLINRPDGIVSASAQVNTGSFTGSFTGGVQGSSSYAPSSWNAINNVPVGLVSSSTQVNTGSFTGSFTGNVLGSSSFAFTTWTSVNNIPTSLFSSSTQINTGSFTGSFTGGFQGTSSWAVSASWAPGVGGTADWNTLSNIPVGLVSASAQVNTGSFTGSFTGTLQGSASFAPTTWTSVNNIPIGLVSASAQINTGSFTGSFTGGVLGSASFAPTTWTSVNNRPVGLVSASAQINTGSFTGSFTGGLLGSASFAPTTWTSVNNRPVGLVSASQQVNTGSFTGSFTGGFQGTSSWAVSASWAPGVGGAADWNTLINRPDGIVSSSVQINTGSFTGSFTGGVLGSSSYAPSSWNAVSNIPVGLVSSSAQVNTGSFTGSFSGTALRAVTASVMFFSGLVNSPTLVSSSAQVNTGSFTGSFTGNFNGSASYATTALTASYLSGAIDFPNGLTGSFAGTFVGTASFAQNALTCSYFSGGIDFTDGLVVTGSVTASVAFLGNLTGSASYAMTAAYSPAAPGDWNTLSNKPVGIVSSSVQINTGSFTGSFSGGLLGSASFAATSWNTISNIPVGLVSTSVASSLVSSSVPIIQNVFPDSSNECVSEPFSITSVNDIWPHRVIRFGSASNIEPTVKHGFYGSFTVPDDFSTSASVQISWATHLTTGDVSWMFEYTAYSASQNVDSTLIQAAITTTSSVSGTAFDRSATVLFPTSSHFQPGYYVQYRLSRDGVDSLDTAPGSVAVHDVVFKYLGL